ELRARCCGSKPRATSPPPAGARCCWRWRSPGSPPSAPPPASSARRSACVPTPSRPPAACRGRRAPRSPPRPRGCWSSASGVSPDGCPYFTMEYVPGVPVHEALPPGNWNALVSAAAEIAHGLEVLHAQFLLHGDLKPSNVLAITTGEGDPILRLVDFGLSAAP